MGCTFEEELEHLKEVFDAPVDPVMSVVSGVRVGSHSSEHLLLMWVFRLWCMSLSQHNKQPVNCEEPIGAHSATVKLEPTSTSTFLMEQQEANFDLKVIIGRKEASQEKPLWEDVSPHSCAVKTFRSQWDRLLFRNSVLCRKWESDRGDQMIDQVILPKSLWQTAFEARPSHTTASNCGVQKTLCDLQSRYYWPGLQQFTDWSPGAVSWV